MKSISIAASIVACAATVHSIALAQGGPIEPCTFTATACVPLGTITTTVYKPPFVSTVTNSFDCQGCADVTVTSREGCFGVGPVQKTPLPTVTKIDHTTTTDVCSATPVTAS